MADEITSSGFVRALVPIMTAGLLSLSLADQPAGQPAGPSTRPLSQPASQPQTPGNHRLFFNVKLDGADQKLAYAVWLPKAYQDSREKFPMVVFLLGAGEVGNNHEGIFVHGPEAELLRNPKLAEKSNYIVLSPQCPVSKRWESDGMDQFVLDLIDYTCKTWRVDRNRIYLTGLSMGGKGTWLIAEKSKGLFAAIAPISADEYDAEKISDTLKGTTAWIIVGGNDGGYTKGSQKMRDLLRQNKIDVVYTEVPGQGHSTWCSFYCSQRFYDFLLLHAKGRPPPADRPDEKKLLSIGYTPPESVDAKLADQFKKFLPYWQLLNCGPDMDPGLKDEARGRKNVFVTHPLDQATPCQLNSTLSIPAGKKSTLKLVVGHHPDGNWDLVVRADGKELLKKTVGTDTAKNGWLEADVDLAGFAGKNIFVELLNRANDWHCEAAYWGKVELVSEEIPAQTRPANQPASQPQTPGNHKLFYNVKLDGADRKLAYAVWLPKSCKQDKLPMIVYLIGVGDVGDNHEGIFVHGPPAELIRNPKLAEKSNYIVLSPQCPPGKNWESQDMSQAVLDMIEYACKTWPVDRNRIYLTGLSMGGKGTWLIAEKSKGLFAAIAPMSADEWNPGKIADAIKGTTVWIIVGGSDGHYTSGSQKMRDLLRQNKIDVLYTEVPGLGHNIWSNFYCNQTFYDCLISHVKGQPPPADRPDEKKLLAIYYTPPDSVDAQLAGQFKKFLPYWELLNCGPDMDPGLKDEIRGRKNVFVTNPFDKNTPCRIDSTLSIPVGKKSTLKLIVGHHPDGGWNLVVRADGKELLNKPIGKDSARDGWLELALDLSGFAGKNVFVELFNRSGGGRCEAAYWGKVELVSEEISAQTRPAMSSDAR